MIVVQEFADGTPEAVRARADAELPSWQKKSSGRPIVLYWASPARGSRGIIADVELGTFRACVEMARKYRLAGVFFDRYGDVREKEHGPDTIDGREELVKEIRDLSGELGFDRNDVEPKTTEIRSVAP